MNIQDLRTTMPNYEHYRGWQRPEPVVGIAIHHSGPGTVDEQGLPLLTPQALAERHVREEGRAHVGYHYVIDWDGTVFYLLDERTPAYHVTLPEPDPAEQAAWEPWAHEWRNGQYFNQRYLAILLLGWFDRERTSGQHPLPEAHTHPSNEQWEALLALVRELQPRYGLTNEQVEGHREILARSGFGTSTCPGTELDMQRVRDELAEHQEATRERLVIPGPPPRIAFPANRPLVGLHARNDYTFTPTDWAIMRRARIESLKMMSFTDQEVYARARELYPDLEFIVRLYMVALGPGHVPTPLQFADHFRDLIDGLYHRFGVLKFEIHNEPNHPEGLEGWGASYEDAVAFQGWYRELFTILRQRHPWALFGYPGLAVPHNDLEWLEWTREAIEMSDWLGMHCYWQTPEGLEDNIHSSTWGRRFSAYHERYPHKLIEITEYGNSNGQSPPLMLTREAQRRQAVEWLEQILVTPYLGSAHGFVATSPDPRWAREGFTWGDENGAYPVAAAIGALPRPSRRPDWHYLFDTNLPRQLPPSTNVTLPVALANSGRLPWRRAGRARTFVNAKWFDDRDREAGESTSVLLPQDVPPGEEAQFQLTVRTPDEAGRYRLRLALYHNGQAAWLHLLDPDTVPSFFSVHIGDDEAAVPALAATYTPIVLPERLMAGALMPALIRVRNEGTRTWQTAGGQPGSIRLAYLWLDEQGQPAEGAGRGELDAPVAPDESVNISLPLQAPQTPGRYRLRIVLVAEDERWLDRYLEREIEVEPATYGVRYDLPPVGKMVAGEQRELTVRLLNSGDRPWETQGRHPITLAHFWLDDGGQTVAPPSLRTLLPGEVPPGESAAVTLSLVAPGTPGNYQLQLDLSREDRFLFSQLGRAPHVQPVAVTPAETVPAWDALWLDLRGPAPITAGEEGRMDVRLRNTGSREWSSADVRLAYRWENGLPRLVKLPHDVPPGTDVALGLPITPVPAGDYRLSLDLWLDGRGWLGLAAPHQEVEVEPGEGPVEATPPEKELLETAPMPALEHRVDERIIEAEAAGAFYPEIRRETDQELDNHLLAIPVRSAIASHNPERASLAVDGHTLTAWGTRGRQEPGMWFLLDLGDPQAVRRIRVTSYKEQFPSAYRLEASLDGREWDLLDEQPDNRQDLDVWLPVPHRARYLRITQTGETTRMPWSVRSVILEQDNVTDSDGDGQKEAS